VSLPGRLCIPWIILSLSFDIFLCCDLMDLINPCLGMSAPRNGPSGASGTSFGPCSLNISPHGSSIGRKATWWNRLSSCIILEISFEPAVTWSAPIVVLKTSMRRIALATPSDRNARPGPSSPSPIPGPIASEVGSASPDWAAHCFASRFASSADR
ncbi:hypothetical protein B0J15DRAFT_498302, partial [Fusarium solani]